MKKQVGNTSYWIELQPDGQFLMICRRDSDGEARFFFPRSLLVKFIASEVRKEIADTPDWKLLGLRQKL